MVLRYAFEAAVCKGDLRMILVEISVPVLDEKFDFQVNEDTKICTLVQEISKILQKKSGGGDSQNADGFVLSSLDQNRILDERLSLSACGIKSGGRLLLV